MLEQSWVGQEPPELSEQQKKNLTPRGYEYPEGREAIQKDSLWKFLAQRLNIPEDSFRITPEPKPMHEMAPKPIEDFSFKIVSQGLERNRMSEIASHELQGALEGYFNQRGYTLTHALPGLQVSSFRFAQGEEILDVSVYKNNLNSEYKVSILRPYKLNDSETQAA